MKRKTNYKIIILHRERRKVVRNIVATILRAGIDGAVRRHALWCTVQR